MDPNSLDPVFNGLTTVMPILGALVIIGGGLRLMLDLSRGYPLGGGGTVIGVGFLLGTSGFIIPALVSGPEPADSGKTTDEPAKEPPPMPDIDWSLVGWIGAGVLGLVVALVLVFYIAGKAQRAATRDADERDRLDRIWKESVQRHDLIREQWMDYQHDIEKVLSFPLLSDVSEPKTAAFIEALGVAADLSSGRRPKSAEAVERYAQATRTAQTRWTAALHYAERVKLARFAPEERKTIQKVQRLMKQALSGGATPEERRAFYQRAEDMLGDLIRLPEATREAIEQTVRGEIEAPKPPAQWPLLRDTAGAKVRPDDGPYPARNRDRGRHRDRGRQRERDDLAAAANAATTAAVIANTAMWASYDSGSSSGGDCGSGGFDGGGFDAGGGGC